MLRGGERARFLAPSRKGEPSLYTLVKMRSWSGRPPCAPRRCSWVAARGSKFVVVAAARRRRRGVGQGGKRWTRRAAPCATGRSSARAARWACRPPRPAPAAPAAPPTASPAPRPRPPSASGRNAPILVTIGRVLVHLEAFIFAEAPALGQDGGVYAHFADIVQLGAVVNLFAKNLRYAALLGRQLGIFIATDDVIAGVFVMNFGGAGEQSDRYHEC